MNQFPEGNDLPSPGSGRPRSYTDGHGETVEEFLERKRVRVQFEIRRPEFIPAERAPLRTPYLKEKKP